MSRGDGGNILKNTRAVNHLSYFQIFYKYIKDFNKDRNFLFYEMKDLNRFILDMKECDNKYIKIQINLINTIIKDRLISDEFRNYLQNLLLYLKN